MEAYLPSLYSALGIYIPLIVVNCIILGRAEAYASKNPPLPSLFDGIGMGLGFTIGLTIIGSVAGDNMIKGLLSGCFGVLMGTIGIDIFNGTPRYTFGSINMESGIQLVPAMIGLFVVAQAFAEMDTLSERFIIAASRLTDRFMSLTELRASLPNFIRSGLIGTAIGILFFVLVLFAALTSSIALTESAVSTFQDELGWGRKKSTAVVGVVMLALGTLLGVFSTTRSRVLRAISRVYVEFYQNTPLPVQVLFMYMAGPQFLQAITGADQPVRIAPFVLGFLGVGLYHAASISEVIRTGIEAVPRGQMEAAQSQGFTRAQAYWYIVLPQTFKIILPPLCNQALNLVKNTSVLALVAGGDLMYRSDNFVSLYGYLQGYIVCCLMYFIICFPLAMLVQWLERRSKERPRGVSLAELGLDNVEEA